jgi:hypothetical protein
MRQLLENLVDIHHDLLISNISNRRRGLDQLSTGDWPSRVYYFN